jgi:D-amino peptidase
VSGDEAVAREAREIIPNVYTAAVKKGLTRFSAEIMHPVKAWDLIAKQTAEAVKNYRQVGRFNPAKPVELKIDYAGNTQLVDCVAQTPGVKRINGATVSYTADTLKECVAALLYINSWMLG